DLPDAVAVADADERADEVARFDGPAGPGGEHQTGVGPGGAEFHLVGFLLLLASGQRAAGKTEQREITAASPGLDRADAQLSLGAMALLATVDDLGLKVDVLPAQAEDFPAAHSVEEQQHKCRV